jgi:hypothetical protein
VVSVSHGLNFSDFSNSLIFLSVSYAILISLSAVGGLIPAVTISLMLQIRRVIANSAAFMMLNTTQTGEKR